MKILVTGGAGYIGTTLVPLLLQEDHKVTVLDNLLHGAEPIVPFFRSKNFTFIKGDVRDLKIVDSAMKGKDAIVHLAAIVGMPACKNNPWDANSVNYSGSRNVRDSVGSEQRIIYASTVSSYGRVEGNICTEETPLRPLSLYGETKAEAERLLLSFPGTIALRFSTLFGLSPRMRLDLMTNDFTYQAVRNKSVVVYQADYVRSSVHVSDAANAIRTALTNSLMVGKVFNVVGCNPTKRDICEVIKKETGAYFHFAEIGEDADQRSAEVSGKKIQDSTSWKPLFSLEEGVHEMARAFSVLKIHNPYMNI